MAGVMGYIIVAALAIIILGSLIGTITDNLSPSNATDAGNVTGAVGVVAALIPVILLIGVIWKLWKSSGAGTSS